MIQDARYLVGWPNRASSLDILDNNATRSCTITQAASGKDPQLDTCLNEFLVDQVAPDVHCLASGVCNDPLKIPSTGVPVPLSADLLTGADDMRDPGGGISIRLVFDKVLDNSIETVTMDPTKPPGKTNKYTIMPGILQLQDASGMPVDSIYYYDNGGSPNYSADLELVPLGPAIVIKPTSTLLASSKYTVKIMNPGALKDREGNAATGLGGGALPASLSFTTEDLTPAGAGNFGSSGLDYPDFTMPPATILPNEVIQISFFEPIAGDSATVAIKSGCTGAKPVAFSDRGGDKTSCTKADPGSIIVDVYNGTTTDPTTALPDPLGWPAGDCTLTITVPDITGKSPAVTADYSFTVMGMPATDPKKDPNIQSLHLLPQQCTM